jgi:hypothetical protein
MDCSGNTEGIRGTPLWVGVERRENRTFAQERRRRCVLPLHSKSWRKMCEQFVLHLNRGLG